jgi:hypothetical protein
MLFIALAVPSTGCTTHVFLSQPLREAYELGVVQAPADDVAGGLHRAPARSPADLQYFTSTRIVLEREVDSHDASLAHGRIVVRRGRLVDRVIVRRGTPGVAVDWGPDWIAVSFEEGTRLLFELVHAKDFTAPGSDREPDGFVGTGPSRTYYRLRTTRDPDGRTVVDFNGHPYEPVGESALAQLQAKRNAWTTHRFSRRVLRGRRID